jgi:hypothetical protein
LITSKNRYLDTATFSLPIGNQNVQAIVNVGYRFENEQGPLHWRRYARTGADMQQREKWRWRICAYRDLLFGKSHFIIFTT